MNVVLLVGRVSNRPFRPGSGERVFLQIDVPSARRSGTSDEIELHCFGQTANNVERDVHFGDMVEVRGRIEQRVGRDAEGEYDDLRIVADEVSVVRTVPSRSAAGAGGAGAVEDRQPACDGTSCAGETFIEGVVKAFKPNQHFGFISVPNVEKDVFFGARDIHDRAALQPGDTVRFVLQQRERGPGATHISLVD
jgi:cold shock CspA family protein